MRNTGKGLGFRGLRGWCSACNRPSTQHAPSCGQAVMLGAASPALNMFRVGEGVACGCGYHQCPPTCPTQQPPAHPIHCGACHAEYASDTVHACTGVAPQKGAREFKVGQRVQCIDGSDTCFLRDGVNYEVARVDWHDGRPYLTLRGLESVQPGYPGRRFIPAPAEPEAKTFEWRRREEIHELKASGRIYHVLSGHVFVYDAQTHTCLITEFAGDHGNRTDEQAIRRAEALAAEHKP